MKVKCPNCGRKTFSFWRKYFVGTKYSIARAMIGHAPCFDCGVKLVYPTFKYYAFSALHSIVFSALFIGGISLYATYIPTGFSYGIVLFFSWFFFIAFSTSYMFFYFMPMVVYDETKFCGNAVPENKLKKQVEDWLKQYPHDKYHIMAHDVRNDHPVKLSVTVRFSPLTILFRQTGDGLVECYLADFGNPDNHYRPLQDVVSDLGLEVKNIDKLKPVEIFDVLSVNESCLREVFEQNKLKNFI